MGNNVPNIYIEKDRFTSYEIQATSYDEANRESYHCIKKRHCLSCLNYSI